jgi:MFS family permease
VTRARGPLYALFVADSVSLAGNAATRVAIPWFVLETTGSAAITGLTAFFSFLPVVLAAFFGGAVVDRIGFRATSVAADLASAAAVALIPALHLTVGIETWQLIALVFLGALLDAPGTTARAALLPDLAERAGMRLERATGIAGSIHRGSVLLGAPLAGVLIGVIGATSVLWLDAASFLVSAGLVAAVVSRPTRAPSLAPDSRYAAHLLEGVRFIRRDRLLRVVVATVLITNFLDAPMVVVYPVFAREAFGSAEALGLMLGTFGGFALLGAAAFGAVGHRLPRRWTYLVGFFVVGLAWLGLSALPMLPVTLALLALAGLAAGPINPILDTVGYERIPPELRGRVLGTVTAGAWAAIPAGTLLGGVVIGSLGVGPTLLVIGICYVLVTGSGFFNPAFQELDRMPERAAVGPAA